MLRPRLAKPYPDDFKKLHACEGCHRSSSCLGYVCATCGFRIGIMQLIQLGEPGNLHTLYGMKRCRCGDRKWLYPCEVPGIVARQR